METILVKYHEYNLTRHDLGWQYHCVYKPFFTLAVTNRINDDATDITNGNNDKNAQFSGLDANDINAIDDYNGLSPLHYAVRLNHGPAVESLLRAGADANLRDGENHSPVYWSVREDVSLTIFDLLAQYGATDKRSAYVNEFSKGELFGRVAATEQIMQEKQDAAVALQKKRIDAQVAATAIRDNLKLMQHRGEQIDELGSKATALNEGAQDFASMAKQLKEASKKKSQWLPF